METKTDLYSLVTKGKRSDIVRAITALRDHHSSIEYRPENNYPNVVNTDGHFLSAYIPYIGKRYFDTKPRVLIYAMAQNLARAPKLIKAWHNRSDGALFRQYHQLEKLHASITPYDDGHLKVIAALVLNAYPNTEYKSSNNIHNMIAITNFVKFSFYRTKGNGQMLDANPPLSIYDDMWKNYSEYEINILKPDIIVGVGNDVASAIKRNLRQDIKLLKIPFPGKLNLCTRYIPKGKVLIKEKGQIHLEDIARLQALIRGTPDKDGVIKKAIKTDWYYFREMETFIRRKLAN